MRFLNIKNLFGNSNTCDCEKQIQGLKDEIKGFNHSVNTNIHNINKNKNDIKKHTDIIEDLKLKNEEMLQQIELIRAQLPNISDGDLSFIYPPTVDIDTFDFGNWTPATANPITEGFTITDDIGGQSVLTMLAPNNVDRFKGTYSKHTVFNADDTIMKFRSSNGTAFVPVATAGNSATYTYQGVDGGGFWSNTDPDLLYVLFNYENTDVALKTQTPTTSYGNETLIHDFTSTHRQISFGFNEGNIDRNDKYVVVTARKKAGYSGLEYEAIVMDLEDCRNNPNQASNIYSRMDIESPSVVDWVSVSQTGDYIVKAVFNDTNPTTGNPINGSLIIVYDNTVVTPTLTNQSKLNSAGNAISGAIYMNESHADLGIDINGEDCYVGFKNNTNCNTNNADTQGGCMEYDNDTFMVIVRLRDGLTQYKFKHTDNQAYGNRGIYGGYVSCRNTKRLGWAYITEDCCQRDGCPSTDVFAIPLNYISTTIENNMQFFGRTYAERTWVSPEGVRDDSAQAVPSRNGHMVSFDSFFSNDGLYNLHPDGGAAQGVAWLLTYPQN